MRALSRQIVTEFFVSPDLFPGDALPYIPTDEDIRESLKAVVKDGIVQCSLWKAIAFVLANDDCHQQHTKLKEMVHDGKIAFANTKFECWVL